MRALVRVVVNGRFRLALPFRHNWVLRFNEAEAGFGQRGGLSDGRRVEGRRREAAGESGEVDCGAAVRLERRVAQVEVVNRAHLFALQTKQMNDVIS